MLIQLQLELNAFRAQWMSELKPSSGVSGRSDRLLRATALRRTQELAREEKVRRDIISADHVSVFTQVLPVEIWSAVQLLTRVIFSQATELFLRAVDEEHNGAVYEGLFKKW